MADSSRMSRPRGASSNRGERNGNGNGHGTRRARRAVGRKRSRQPFRIIVMGASAGGVGALSTVISGLPGGLPAAVLVVLHMSPKSPGFLPDILGRNGPLPSRAAVNGELIQPGRIYVSPPDHHLLVDRGRIHLTRGPRENNARPAVDPLFRTAAQEFGPAVIGVVLSGGLDDGTAGLMEIKQHGGIAIVQDPEDAPFPSMPASSIEHVDVDYVRPVDQIGPLLAFLAGQPVEEVKGGVSMSRAKSGSAKSSARRRDRDVADVGTDALKTQQMNKPPSDLTCPDCGGALWEFEQNGLVRYRCHVGHGFTAQALAEAQSKRIEDALWTALRALEESVAMRRRMSRMAHNVKSPNVAREYEAQAKIAEAQAGVVRDVLTGGGIIESRQAREIEQKAVTARDPSLVDERSQNRKSSARRNRGNGSSKRGKKMTVART